MSSAEWAAGEWNKTEWENEQMKLARLSPDDRAVVRRLLDAYYRNPLEVRNRQAIMETFAKLSDGEALVVPDLPTERWEAANPGRLHQRDTVRVRFDAYKDDAGRMHNGRRGRVIAVRYGDIVVRYEDGRQPPFDAVHHPPAKLERLIK